MMTDWIIFCEYVAYYALGKSILHTFYAMCFSYYDKGWGKAKKRLTRIALIALGVWAAWIFALTTEYDVWVVTAASILAARITWREIKTIGGLRDDDWDACMCEFKLVDLEDWVEGIGAFICGEWGFFNIFNIFSRDRGYEEDRRINESYYDARWYYTYGDGKNG